MSEVEQNESQEPSEDTYYTLHPVYAFESLASKIIDDKIIIIGLISAMIIQALGLSPMLVVKEILILTGLRVAFPSKDPDGTDLLKIENFSSVISNEMAANQAEQNRIRELKQGNILCEHINYRP